MLSASEVNDSGERRKSKNSLTVNRVGSWAQVGLGVGGWQGYF